MGDTDKRAKIERSLGRALSDDELRTVSSIDSLSSTQAKALAAIRSVDIMAAAFFLKAVVPTCGLDVINRFVRDFEPHLEPVDFSAPLKLEKLYQSSLGRELVTSERAIVPSFAGLNIEQLALARILSIKDLLVGLSYLGEVVPSARGVEREAFATELANSRDTRDSHT